MWAFTKGMCGNTYLLRTRVTLRWRRFLRRTATGEVRRLRASLRLRRLRVLDA